MAEHLPERLKLEIVTPSELLFSGEVDMVTVPGRSGYLGILPGHAPLLSELKPGVLSYRAGGEVRKLFCGWGFVEVLPDRVSVLTDQAELPEQVDSALAEQEKMESELMLRSKDPETDFIRELERWEAAVARLEVVRGGRD
jgi:F-type H+-transporting ATPase subunit epsilon